MLVKVITKENFESEVLQTTGKVLIDFWAAWCGPCQMMSPIVDEFAENHPEVKVGKINIDEQPELAEKFNVEVIPTLKVFSSGKVVNESVGVIPPQKIEELLK